VLVIAQLDLARRATADLVFVDLDIRGIVDLDILDFDTLVIVGLDISDLAVLVTAGLALAVWPVEAAFVGANPPREPSPGSSSEAGQCPVPVSRSFGGPLFVSARHSLK
jgi:hypothetical protein